MNPPALARFGERIVICGPSNSGKSTLAVALGQKLGLPVVHLDLLHHLPNTDWVRRSPEEFQRLHDEAVLGDGWVMDGNYSRLFPQRLARATGIILLGDSRWANLRRYVRRTLFQRNRPGALPGGNDTLKWAMIRWILVVGPRNIARYRAMLPEAGRPFVEIRSMRELKQLYFAWELLFDLQSERADA